MSPLCSNLFTFLLHASVQQGRFELLADLDPRKAPGAFFCHDDNVPRRKKRASMAAKELPQQPLEAITDNRITHLCADRNAESTFTAAKRLAEENEMRRVNFSALAEQIQELRAFRKTSCFGKNLCFWKQPALVLGASPLGWDNHNQSFAAFSPSALKNFSTAGSCHPHEKTVRSLAFEVARLIGSLHLKILPAKSSLTFQS